MMVLIMFVSRKIKQASRIEADSYVVGRKGFKSGMTLIELMVTVVVLALGIAAITGLHVATVKAAMDSNHLTMASFIAESQHEWLRSMEFNRVAFVSDEPEQLGVNGEECGGTPPNPCFFTRTVTIEKGVPTSRSYSVSIKVQWLNREIIYNTVVSDVGFS